MKTVALIALIGNAFVAAFDLFAERYDTAIIFASMAAFALRVFVREMKS